MANMASGLITITFDDGLLNQYENGYPILHEYHVNGVVFIPTGLVGDWFEGQRAMGLTHLRELACAGWEIGSHTVSHPHLAKRGKAKLLLPALQAELRESREWILANGFPVISLAYPFGGYNEEVAEIARRYYHYARIGEEGLNEFSSRNVRLKSFNLCQNTLHRWKPAVDAALASRKWLIARIHSVVLAPDQIPAGKEPLYIARDELAEGLQYALSSGLPVRTLQEVYETCQDLPETAEATSVPSQQLPAGVEIKVRMQGSTSTVAVKDEQKAFKLKFRFPSAERAEILSEIRKRIALDLNLSLEEIEQLAEFDTYA